MVVSGAPSSSHANGRSRSQTNGPSPRAAKAVGEQLQHSFLTTFVIPSTLLIIMPNMMIWIWYCVKYFNGSFTDFFATCFNSPRFLIDIWSHVTIGSPFSIFVVGGYMLFQLILMAVVPGDRVEGPLTPAGNVPVYKDNGFRIYLITMASFAGLTFYLKSYTQHSPSLVYDNFGDLMGTINVFALLFCALLYFKGMFLPSTTDSGTSGNPIFDYYWGTELYPRIFGIDVKVFTNCRFGCTVWGILPCCFTLKAYELHGFENAINNFVSVTILLAYLTKFFWWEAGYMCTMDIILDRAGYYICWGCLCFIPGLYASFSFYLVSHPKALGYPLALAIVFAGFLCIAINYLADWQRQDVRATDGQTTIWGSKPEIIRAKYHTAQGEEKSSLLLVSGFWGMARHFHYLPEIGLAFFWSVPCGFEHILPYLYLIFLIILLIHRTYRDDIKCTNKYGKYWQQYKESVPYRIIPYIF